MKTFYSHGKLLLSGEYLVLKGAKALAVPCKMGQTLNFKPENSSQLLWESLDKNGQTWFTADFSIGDFGVIKTNDNEVANRLRQILRSIRRQNPDFLKKSGGGVKTFLEFDRQWGLGTSSTLIANLAQWAGVNPYIILDNTLGGSGYDIACASADKPLFYTRGMVEPKIEYCDFNPNFKNSLYFVYLNRKKNSRDAVAEFMQKDITEAEISKANELSNLMATAEGLSDFQYIITEHESFISQLLSIPTIKENQFKDFNGAIKSLGAWGGDFVLASGGSNTPDYFRAKGFPIVMSYDELIL